VLLGSISGILIAFIPALLLSTTAQLSFIDIFTKNTTDFTINVGRFFLLSGIAIFLIETPNILRIAEINAKPVQSNRPFVIKILFGLQVALGIFFLYMFSMIILSISSNHSSGTLANLVLCYSLLIAGAISLASTIPKAWLKNTRK
jgi:hypothetical protein